MKTFISILCLFFFIFLSLLNAQTTDSLLFSDNFESGTSNWITQGTWGLDTNNYYSPQHSLNESPYTNYGANLNIITTKSSSVDLTNFLGATIKFWGKYNIEEAFDFVYLEVSSNGTDWNPVSTFTGEVTSLTEFIFNIDGYTGQPYFENGRNY